jgi:alkylation response protein AidB-like acyl-CoA dehydrogenase
MNFDLADEQKLFAESVRRFAQTHLAAGALKRAHDPRFPYDVAQLIGRARDDGHPEAYAADIAGEEAIDGDPEKVECDGGVTRL